MAGKTFNDDKYIGFHSTATVVGGVSIIVTKITRHNKSVSLLRRHKEQQLLPDQVSRFESCFLICSDQFEFNIEGKCHEMFRLAYQDVIFFFF